MIKLSKSLPGAILSPDNHNLLEIGAPDFHEGVAGDPYGEFRIAVTARRRILLAWEGDEHRDSTTDAAGFVLSKYREERRWTGPLRLPEHVLSVGKVKLELGDISALAGDWWGRFDDQDKPDAPMDDAITAASLREANPDELKRALTKVYDRTASDNIMRQFFQLNGVLPLLGRVFSDEPETQPSGAGGASTGAETRPADGEQIDARSIRNEDIRYVLLALKNWDHFHPFSIRRYVKLHARAVKAAELAGNLSLKHGIFSHSVPSSVDLFDHEGFKLALAINAFADHFLADSFSAGHIVTDRKALHDAQPSVYFTMKTAAGDVRVDGGEIASGRAAQTSHDDANRKGVDVTCAAAPGRKYKARGDGHLLDRENGENYEYLKRAQRASMAEVIKAFLMRSLPSDPEGLPSGGINLLGTEPSLLRYVPHNGRCGCPASLRDGSNINA